jgi:DNA-binding CsgD family transcriptional regulator
MDPQLRARAMREDESAAKPIDLSRIWRDLVSGHDRIEGSFHSEGRCYLALAPRQAADWPTSRNLRILENWLVYGSQKRVAIEFGVSASTVAAAAKHCLDSMGLRCVPCRVPSILVMASSASTGIALDVGERVSELRYSGRVYRVVSAERLDNQLVGLLTCAELSVVRGLVEGRCYAEIALGRGSSPRTVANQVATAFQRLNVSGRSDLLSTLVRKRARPS